MRPAGALSFKVLPRLLFACALLLVLYAQPAEAAEVKMAGAIEAETGYEKTSLGKGMDIVAAKVQVDFEATVNEHVRGFISLLWEEDATDPIAVDEGYIRVGMPADTYLKAGKYALGFGAYPTQMLSDPVTYEAGSTNQSAIAVGYGKDALMAELGTFNGDVNKSSDTCEKINVYYAALNHTAGDEGGLSAGASIIGSLADSDSIQEYTDTDLDGEPGPIKSHVPGVSAFVSHEKDGFGVSAEYLTATDDFEPGELDFARTPDGSMPKAKPQAWNIEAWATLGEKTVVAVRVEGSKDLYSFQPELQYGAAIGFEVYEATVLGFEYMHGSYQDNWDGLQKRDMVKARLAVGF